MAVDQKKSIQGGRAMKPYIALSIDLSMYEKTTMRERESERAR